MKKQLILIIVGPDMCGKTQIAKALANELNIPYFKASSERSTYLNKNDVFVQQLRYADPRMIDFLDQTGYSVVMDRGYPCEFAYAKVLSRETDHAALRQSDTKMASLNAAIIFCRRSAYEGIFDDIDPSTLKEEILQKLDDAYVEFFQQTQCKTMFLNVDDENLEREVGDVVEFLKTNELITKTPREFANKAISDARGVLSKLRNLKYVEREWVHEGPRSYKRTKE